MQEQYGRDFYAPQTFSNQPEGRRIEIGWWRTNTALGALSFNQSMSIPLEHKLVQTPEGIRLTRMPVKETAILRGKVWHKNKFAVKENQPNPLKDISIELAELQISFEPGKAAEVVLDIRGVPVVYNAAKKNINCRWCNSACCCHQWKNNITCLRRSHRA